MAKYLFFMKFISGQDEAQPCRPFPQAKSNKRDVNKLMSGPPITVSQYCLRFAAAVSVSCSCDDKEESVGGFRNYWDYALPLHRLMSKANDCMTTGSADESIFLMRHGRPAFHFTAFGLKQRGIW